MSAGTAAGSPTGAPRDPTSAEAHEPPATLSRAWFWGVLAVALAIFVGLNPIWRPLDMAAMDRNILWSYAPIPVLVAAGLASQRKLAPGAWFLETLRLTLIKFGLTFGVMHALWSYIDPPSVPHDGRIDWEPAATAAGPFSVRPVPAATPAGAYETAHVAGRVVDAAGRPVADALVAVTGGLAPVVFSPPADELLLDHDGAGLGPGPAVAQAHQVVLFRNRDDELHTVRGRDADGEWLFNRAVVPRGERPVMFRRGRGIVTLRCGVPGHDEPPLTLLVAGGPFVARTGADGAFAFDGVPAGSLELSALDADGTRQARVDVHAAPDAEDRTTDAITLVLD